MAVDLILTPTAANANVKGDYLAVGQAGARYTGLDPSGDCTLTSAPGSDTVTKPTAIFTHGIRHKSVDIDATFASTDSASDTVRIKGHLDSRLTLNRKHKQLKSFELAAGGSMKMIHSMANSTCQGSGAVVGETLTLFTERKKGWFYLTHDVGKKNSVIEVELVDLDREKVVALDIFAGTHSQATSRAKLKPGHYEVLAIVGVTVGNDIGIGLSKASLAEKVKLTTTVSGEFKPIRKK